MKKPTSQRSENTDPTAEALTWNRLDAVLLEIRDVQRATNKSIEELRQLLRGHGLANAAEFPAAGSPAAEPLPALVKRYLEEHQGGARWAPGTKVAYEYALELLRAPELLGADPITGVTRDRMVHVRDILRRLPKNWRKSPKYRGRSITEILTMPDIKPMSTTRVNFLLRAFKVFFAWVVEQGYIRSNPVRDLEIKSRGPASSGRIPYPRGDLQKILDKLAEEVKEPCAHAERLWVPLIAMYCGMRLNEICQLYCDDTREEAGILYFSVSESTNDKRVKSRHSCRSVPVHPTLVELGLGDYLAHCRTKGTVRLWPALCAGSAGYGTRFGQWFIKFNRRCVTTEHGKVFHSLRHNFAQELANQNVPQWHITVLLGHAPVGETAITYARPTVPMLAEEISNLDYHLNLDGIRRACRKTFARE